MHVAHFHGKNRGCSFAAIPLSPFLDALSISIQYNCDTNSMELPTNDGERKRDELWNVYSANMRHINHNDTFTYAI